jgi:hypothetical protein
MTKTNGMTRMLNRLHVAGWSALVVVSLAGCDQLLKQTAPSRVNADGLEVPANAKLLVDGARAASDVPCKPTSPVPGS